jgi:hypothetical protein
MNYLNFNDGHTDVLILTNANMNAMIRDGHIEAPQLSMVSRHDFVVDSGTWNTASYVLYIDPRGVMKVLKERKPIVR